MFGEDNSSGVNRRIIPLILSVIFFSVIFFTFAVVVIFFSSSCESEVSRDVHQEEGTIYHKYLWVNTIDGESRQFESKRGINEFSLHEVEYGARIFPLSQFGSSIKEYVCECDLLELEDYLIEEGIDSEMKRRGLTSTNNRRSAGIVSAGTILAGAVGLLIMLLKTNVITLRIFAENEMKAEKIAANEISSRIISEIIDTSRTSKNCGEDARRRPSMWMSKDLDDMEERMEECQDCEKVKELEDALDKRDEKIKKLETKIEELTSCSGVVGKKNSNSNDEEEEEKHNHYYPGFFELCSGVCVDREELEPKGELSCLKFGDWEGEISHFGGGGRTGDDFAKTAIDQECGMEFSATFLSDETFRCVPYTKKHAKEGFERFWRHDAYKDPWGRDMDEIQNLVDGFNEFCDNQVMLESCYDFITDD